RASRPDGAIGKMMAGRLPVQVVGGQVEAGLLNVGGHPAAHGAQPDEPHRHVILGHPITVAAISDFRSARYRLAVCLRLRKAGAEREMPASRAGLRRPFQSELIWRINTRALSITREGGSCRL